MERTGYPPAVKFKGTSFSRIPVSAKRNVVIGFLKRHVFQIG